MNLYASFQAQIRRNRKIHCFVYIAKMRATYKEKHV